MLLTILAGGQGSRLWPLSRKTYPKQFLPLCSENSMLKDTVMRVGDANFTYFVCNEEHRFLLAEQLRDTVEDFSILLEPAGRNTAPAIALAAISAVEQGRGDEAMLVLPSDHSVLENENFSASILEAERLAKEGYLVTFGIIPTSPETGYGYIRRGSEYNGAFFVSDFIEKPKLDKANEYISSPDYYWNSGMFMLTPNNYLEELERYRSDIVSSCQLALKNAVVDMDFIRVDRGAFLECPDDSIDYAVMEKTEKAMVIPLDAGWSDVGSWSALWEIKNKDENDNVLQGDVVTHDTKGCMLVATDRLVTALGIKDLIVVDTKNAVMVAHKDESQNVKVLVEKLKKLDRDELYQHREVYRPWGKYDLIDTGKRYQVKRITVKPGAKLSLQMHHHRAEHWIVVKGTASVQCGDEKFLLSENQSTYIPLGTIHCLENPGKVDLELIEVQSGSYLGEDDIVRIEDQYGRLN